MAPSGVIPMNESEAASAELLRMIEDVGAQSLFGKRGPLVWFSLRKTYNSACRKGKLTEKQVHLIRSIYRQYTKFKLVSQRFAASGKSRQVAKVLYQVLHDKPKLRTKEDRGRSQRLSRIVQAFHDGVMVHIGHFNDAESIVGELQIDGKILIWEEIHSARRVYLAKLFEVAEPECHNGLERSGNP